MGSYRRFIRATQASHQGRFSASRSGYPEYFSPAFSHSLAKSSTSRSVVLLSSAVSNNKRRGNVDILKWLGLLILIRFLLVMNNLLACCRDGKVLRATFQIQFIINNQVELDKVNLIIGSGGRNVKSIIKENGVEYIDTQDNGIGLCHVCESSLDQMSTPYDVSDGASMTCSTAKAIEWDASWSNNLDPSGRAALGVHNAAYKKNSGSISSANLAPSIVENVPRMMDITGPELVIRS